MSCASIRASEIEHPQCTSVFENDFTHGELFYDRTTPHNMDVATCEAILPVGIERIDGEPPPAPSTFEEGYALPQHYEKPLQKLNSHPLDVHLQFFEKPHVYTWKGVPTSASVTACAHQFEKPFVAADAIKSMKTSRSQAWPRVEYVVNADPIGAWTPRKGAVLVAQGKTIAVVQPMSMQGATVDAMRGVLRSAVIKGCTVDPDEEDAEVFTFDRELTTDEIVAKWSRKGMLTSHMGTEAHYQAELMCNGLPFRWWEPESKVLVDFVRDHIVPKGMVSYATEKEIVCVDADLAGSIDLILYDQAAGLYHIVDHKRTDKLKDNLHGFGKMRPPLNHLDDCKGAAYALQTSIYQYILERDYDMQIGERVLLSLHPDAPFATTVPYLRAEASYIMEQRFALVQARKSALAADPTFRCSLSAAPAVDAVRLDDGGVAMEKAALVRGMGYRVDPVLRAQFERAVSGWMESVEIDSSGCISWRKRMPGGGIVPFF